jgi:hypothetical protein
VSGGQGRGDHVGGQSSAWRDVGRHRLAQLGSDLFRPVDPGGDVDQALDDLGELVFRRNCVRDQRGEAHSRAVGADRRAGGVDPAVVDGDEFANPDQKVLSGQWLPAVGQRERADVTGADDRLGGPSDLRVPSAQEQDAVLAGDVRVIGDQRRLRQIVGGGELLGQHGENGVAGPLPQATPSVQIVKPEGERRVHASSSPTRASTVPRSAK